MVITSLTDTDYELLSMFRRLKTEGKIPDKQVDDVVKIILYNREYKFTEEELQQLR